MTLQKVISLIAGILSLQIILSDHLLLVKKISSIEFRNFDFMNLFNILNCKVHFQGPNYKSSRNLKITSTSYDLMFEISSIEPLSGVVYSS